jgi:hypothetical protein
MQVLSKTARNSGGNMKRSLLSITMLCGLAANANAAILSSGANGIATLTPFTNLSTAVAKTGTKNVTLSLTSNYSVNTLTIPATIKLQPLNGAIITVNSGKTFTYTSSTSDWPRVQVFGGSGTVVFNSDVQNCNGWFAVAQPVTFNASLTAHPQLISSSITFGANAKVPYVYPEWWGTNTTPGTTDMTTPIQAAVNAGGGRVVMGADTYLITSVSLPSGIDFGGQGRTKTVLKVKDDHNDYGLKVFGGTDTDTSKVRGYIHDFSIDGQNGTTALGGLLLDWAYAWTIERVYAYHFYNDSANGFHAKDAFNILFQSCQANMGTVGTLHATGFKVSSTASTGQNVTQIKFNDCLSQYNNNGWMLICLTSSDGITIENSAAGKCTNGITFGAGTQFNTRISENHIEYCTIGIDIGGTTRGLEIVNNFFYGGSDPMTAIKGTAGTIDRVLIDLNTFTGGATGHKVLDFTSVTATYGDNLVFVSFFSVASSVTTSSITMRKPNTVVDKATSYTLLWSDDKTTFTNNGAGGSITFTLPSLASVPTGYRVTFCTRFSQAIVIDPNGTDRIWTLTNAAGDSITSSGGTDRIITLESAGGVWMPVSYAGVWADAN